MCWNRVIQYCWNCAKKRQQLSQCICMSSLHRVALRCRSCMSHVTCPGFKEFISFCSSKCPFAIAKISFALNNSDVDIPFLKPLQSRLHIISV